MRLARFPENEIKLVTGGHYDDKEWYYSTRDGKTSRRHTTSSKVPWS